MANQILLTFINANFDIITKEILPLVEKDYLRVGLSEIVERLKITVLSAAEGSLTKEELSNIWGSLPSDPEIVEALRAVLVDLINKVEEQEVKDLLNLLLDPILQTVVILTDQAGNNKEELNRVWKEFLNSPELLTYGLAHLEWIVRKLIKDENAVKWIMKLINAFTK